MPLVIAVIFTVVCFFIVCLSLYSDPWNTGQSCVLTLTGVPVYYATVHRFRLPRRWRRVFSKSQPAVSMSFLRNPHSGSLIPVQPREP